MASGAHGSPTGVFVGLTTVDLVHRLRVAPGPDEKVRALGQELAAGGPAAGAAVTFAALGGRATLVTCLGGHVLAGVAREDLAARGVTVVDATPHDPGTPAVSAVRVDAAGRRSVSSRDAEGVDAVAPEVLVALVADADVVLLDGHHPALARAAAAAARAPVVLDGGSWKPVLDDVLPRVDVAICGAAFAVPDGSDPVTALLARGVRRVAVTAGAAPVRWWDAGGHGEVAVPVVVARDTLGAGDAFHGAYAYLVSARPDRAFPDALARATRVAGLRCTIPGARAWLDTPAFATLAVDVRGD